MENLPHNIRVSISSGTVIKILAIIALSVALFLVRDLILVLLAAVVIASAIEPATKWFKRYNVGRIPAVLITYVLIVVSLLGIFYFLVPTVLDQASTFITKIPQYLDSVDIWSPLRQIGVVDGNQAVQKITESFSLKDIADNIRSLIPTSSNGLFGTVSSIFGGFMSFLLIVVLSFYLAVQEDGVGQFLRVIVPVKSQKYIIDLWKRSQAKIGLWMEGQILLGLIIAILVYLGLTILGIDHALLLAVFAGIFELIPVFGPILSAIPAVLLGFVSGGASQGFIIIGFYIIIQQFENQLIYPLVVKRIVGISPIIVIIALIVGLKLGGFLGLLLSVPMSAALMEFYGDVQKRKQSELEKLDAAV